MKDFPNDSPDYIVNFYNLLIDKKNRKPLKFKDGYDFLFNFIDDEKLDEIILRLYRLLHYSESKKIWKTIEKQISNPSPTAIDAAYQCLIWKVILPYHTHGHKMSWEELTPSEKVNKKNEIKKKSKELAKLIRKYVASTKISSFLEYKEHYDLHDFFFGRQTCYTAYDKRKANNYSKWFTGKDSGIGVLNKCLPTVDILLNRIADDLEKKYPPSTTLSKHYSDEIDNVRFFMLRATKHFREGYGTPLYETTAILASAIFNKAITKDQVPR